jgi:hypothetical protein
MFFSSMTQPTISSLNKDPQAKKSGNNENPHIFIAIDFHRLFIHEWFRCTMFHVIPHRTQFDQ